MQFMQLPLNFDSMTVGEIKQHYDDQIAAVSRELNEKAAQQRPERIRFVPRKGKMIRANKKWTSARKEMGRSTMNAINTILIQPPSYRPDIFVFGSTKKQASSHTVVGMMHTPTCPTLAGQINHTSKKVRRKNKKPRKLNTYALRLQELKMEVHQRAKGKRKTGKYIKSLNRALSQLRQ